MAAYRLALTNSCIKCYCINEKGRMELCEFLILSVSFPLFSLPHFSKTFVVECHASNGEIGAILSPDRHPFAYLSKALSDEHRVRNSAIAMHVTLNQRVNMKSSIIPLNTTCDVLWERNKLPKSSGCLGWNAGTIPLIILPSA